MNSTTADGVFIRTAMAFLSLSAAAIHFSTAGEHGTLFGIGFLAMAAFQVTWAVLVILAPSPRVLALGLAGNASIVALWLTAHTGGLPFGPGAGEPEVMGLKDLTATGLELLIVAGALVLLHPQTSAVAKRFSVSSAAALPVLGGLIALTGAAVAVPHAHGPHAPGHGQMAGELSARHAADGGTPHSRPAKAGSSARGVLGRHGDHVPETSAADSPALAAVLPGSHGSAHGQTGTAHLLQRARSPGATHPDGHGGSPRRSRSGGGSRRHSSSHPPSNRGATGGGQHSGDQHSAGGQGDPATDGAHSAGAGGPQEPESPSSFGLAYEPRQPAGNGSPASGGAVILRGGSPEEFGGGVEHTRADHGCQPTPDQERAADKLYRDTAVALRQYENAPHKALADGFVYVVGPSDRILHMVNTGRVADPTILDPSEIESFLYAMTDRGLMPIGGMYIMPGQTTRGPEIGGCRTRWHYHGGVVGRALTLGTKEQTAEMLHVWTYPGLDPYGHYDGRALSQLWAPGSYVPSVCHASGACIP